VVVGVEDLHLDWSGKCAKVYKRIVKTSDTFKAAFVDATSLAEKVQGYCAEWLVTNGTRPQVPLEIGIFALSPSLGRANSGSFRRSLAITLIEFVNGRLGQSLPTQVRLSLELRFERVFPSLIPL